MTYKVKSTIMVCAVALLIIVSVVLVIMAVASDRKARAKEVSGQIVRQRFLTTRQIGDPNSNDHYHVVVME